MSWLYYNISSGLIKEKYGSVHPEGHNWKHKHWPPHTTQDTSSEWQGTLTTVPLLCLGRCALCVCFFLCVCVVLECVCVCACVHLIIYVFTLDLYFFTSEWFILCHKLLGDLFECVDASTWVSGYSVYEGSMCLCLCCMFKKGSVFANCVKTASLTSHLGTM